MSIPVIGFSAFSGTGKTTLLEQVVRSLTGQGVRVGVVKHDGHSFEIDHPGKDSWRYAQAGARAVVIASDERTAVVEQSGGDLSQCLARIQGVDVILVEGFKHADIPRVGLCRKATGKPLPEPAENYIAVVTDDPALSSAGPCFSFGDAEPLAQFILKEMKRMPNPDFTHFDESGRAHMVDVGEKAPTHRTADAAGRVHVNQKTFELIKTGGMKKGDVLATAQIAGIMAAKRTWELIPMCHPIPIHGIELKLWQDEEKLTVEIEASVRCDGKTGVEMEALTAVSTAALTVYDMCKAVQRDMVISDIRLLHKTGGIHGDFHREEANHE